MAKLKCGNLFGVVDYNVLIIALVVSLSALLHSNSISKLFFGIVVSIGLLINIFYLFMSCKLNPVDNDCLFNIISICIRLWCSCVLCLMSFVDISGIQNDVKTAITWMLLVSIVIKAVWSIGQRCLGLIKYSPRPIWAAEVVELVGFFVTGLIVLPEDQVFLQKNVFFMVLVFSGFTVVALRLIALSYNRVVIFVLILFTVCGQVGLYIHFGSSFDVHNAAWVCFAYRLLTDPVFDLLFRNPLVLSSMESPSKIVIESN